MAEKTGACTGRLAPQDQRTRHKKQHKGFSFQQHVGKKISTVCATTQN